MFEPWRFSSYRGVTGSMPGILVAARAPELAVACNLRPRSCVVVAEVERVGDATEMGANDARTVFLEHHARLLQLCTLLTGNQDAGEDLAQEAFARALARASVLAEQERYPYLRATASNIWKNLLRRLSIERARDRRRAPRTRQRTSREVETEQRFVVEHRVARPHEPVSLVER